MSESQPPPWWRRALLRLSPWRNNGMEHMLAVMTRQVEKPLLLEERKRLHIAMERWKAEQEASGTKFNEEIPFPSPLDP